MEVAGVKEGDNDDGNQVIDHSQGQQEGAQGCGQEGANACQDGNRKGDIGGSRNSPAVYRGLVAVVNGEVDNSRDHSTAEGCSYRNNSLTRVAQVAHHELFFQL